MDGQTIPVTSRPWLHLGLLVATLLSTSASYFVYFANGGYYEQLWASATFGLSTILILGTHEMGHYLMARKHQVSASLPYFIPFPFVMFGTLGAVIRLRGKIPSRDALVDVGVWGPLAGFIVAVPVLILGLVFSKVVPSPALPSMGFPEPGSLWGLAARGIEALRHGGEPSAPSPAGWILGFGDNLLTLGLQRLVVGALPAGMDIDPHPMVLAGWFGTLVTMLNLIPVGQLDGGHLTYALLGEKARTLGKAAAGILLVFSLIFSAGWIIWFFVVSKVVGFGHPPVLDGQAPMSASRRWVCYAAIAVLVLCLMPVQVRQFAVPLSVR